MSKLQFPNKKQYIVTIPKALVEAKGWKTGDEVIFSLDSNGNLVLKKSVTDSKMQREEGE